MTTGSLSGSRRLSAFVLAVAFPTLASAQVRFEVGPLAALYAPTGSFEPAIYYTIRLPKRPSDLTALAWGGEARFWFAGRLGVQVQAAEAATSVGGGSTPSGTYYAPTPARVLTLTTQVLCRFYSASKGGRAWLSAGAGLIRHGGAAYDRYGAPSQMTGVLGAGYAVPIGRRLHSTAGVTTLLYSFDLRDSNRVSLERGPQTDVVIHFGVSWGWP